MNLAVACDATISGGYIYAGGTHRWPSRPHQSAQTARYPCLYCDCPRTESPPVARARLSRTTLQGLHWQWTRATAGVDDHIPGNYPPNMPRGTYVRNKNLLHSHDL